MTPNKTSAAAFADTKPHYHLLDGLRGVAALVVICYHIGEDFATNSLTHYFNHGYLAVDFFFMLSGFVIGYAYDDRRNTMGVMAFLKRRVIRLHPMVVICALFGGLMFYGQATEYLKVSDVPVALLAFATLLNMFLVPAWSGVEVRGFGEIFPLNGPTWSLFFEYIANVLYVLAIRKLSTRWLALLVFAMAGALFGYAVTNGSGTLWLGASGETTDALSTRVCNFLGDISYPLYIVHFPLLYTCFAYAKRNNLPFCETIPTALALVFASIALAWICLKFYDVPVRRWLQKRFA